MPDISLGHRHQRQDRHLSPRHPGSAGHKFEQGPVIADQGLPVCDKEIERLCQQERDRIQRGFHIDHLALPRGQQILPDDLTVEGILLGDEHTQEGPGYGQDTTRLDMK